MNALTFKVSVQELDVWSAGCFTFVGLQDVLFAQSDESPMSLEEMRAAFISNKSDDKDWYEDESRDKELDSTPKPKKSTSLIDRAKKANKENPRPGSADYKKQ